MIGRWSAGPATGLAALLFTQGACGSPFEVDSTSIASGIELKAGFDYRDGMVSDSFTVPKIAIATPLAKNLELEVGSDRRKHQEPDGGRTTERGILELKWRFRPAVEHGASWALIPELTIPLHDSSRDSGRSPVELVAPVVMQKSFGALTLDARAGYGRELEKGGEGFVPIGILVRFQANRALELGAEIAGESPLHRLGDCTLRTNAGFKWHLTEQFELHGLIGWTVRSAGDDAEMQRVKLVAQMAL